MFGQINHKLGGNVRESVKSAVSLIGLILGLIFFYILYLANKEQSKINQELHEQAIKNCNENLRHGYLGDPSDPASGVICRKIESEYFQKYGRAP